MATRSSKPARSSAPSKAKAKKGAAAPPVVPPSWTDEVDPAVLGPMRLRRTLNPGVYLNSEGVQVDERGLLLSLRDVQEAEQDQAEAVIGESLESPAQLLKLVALDPRLPLGMRLDAAKAAAPYYDRRMPLGLDGGGEDKPIKTQSSVLVKNLNALDAGERKAALALLEKLGVLGGVPE